MAGQFAATTIRGRGTNGTVPVFTGVTSLGNSLISQSGSVVTIAGSLAVQAITQAETLGSELVTDGSFATDPSGSWTTTGWTWDSVNLWMTHNTGNTTALVPNPALSITAGTLYKLVYTVAGSLGDNIALVTASLGGRTGLARFQDGTFTEYFLASATTNLSFTPTTTFEGTIDAVSVKTLNTSLATTTLPIVQNVTLPGGVSSDTPVWMLALASIPIVQIDTIGNLVLGDGTSQPSLQARGRQTAGAGWGLTVKADAGNSGAGGALSLSGGIGVGATKAGGNVNITGGSQSAGAKGGSIQITGGSLGAGGGDGGDVLISGGIDGGAAGSKGGSVTIAAAQGVGAAGSNDGNVVIKVDRTGGGAILFQRGSTLDWKIQSSGELVSSNRLQGTVGAGTNIVGGNFTLGGGQSSGNAAPASINFATTTAGGSGVSLQSFTNRWQVDGANSGNLRPVTDDSVGIGIAATGIKQLFAAYTNTATVGAVTINKMAGRVNIAAAGTAVTVTNSLVTAASHVLVVASTNDTTARVTSVVPAAGSFVINTVAVTAQTSFDFLVINAD